MSSQPESDLRVQPIPPAGSIADSVRSLNVILEQLSGPRALEALKRGDACANVDSTLWAAAWEGARSFRDHFLLTLARHTRNEWRSDVRSLAELGASEVHQAELLSGQVRDLLESRLRITLDFAFKHLAPRHLCFLGDALQLAFEPDISPAEFRSELVLVASRSPNASGRGLDALLLGASGAYRFQPERVMLSTGPLQDLVRIQ